MRLAWFLAAALVAAAAGGAQAQLSLGQNGLSVPPINLVSVFKFVRDIFMSYMYPPETTEGVQKREDDEELQRDDVTERVAVIGFDAEGNIVEKFDSWCAEDETGECMERQEPGEGASAAASAAAFVPGEGEVEDKDATTQLVLGKWPLIYVVLITMLFWIILVIATPYVLTGETYGRREDDFGANSIVDQQDVLLLLSWLLGEASNDPSCLKRVVCLTPAKSSRYISVSSMIFKVLNFFQRWLPYSRRVEDLLLRLDEVARDGFSQNCQQYYCPTVPEL
ncbi:uncharacterized protein LOC122249556 [Penaeus japonicus]|uniref:uncharacterized protein LOC122249556 n=1 Tax=Penaeus japonicus TaxID=27405 RepID=UPI001C70BF6B|nr:uncharacterized protein LOC122249556 [Penaeus japonicus]